MKACPYCVKYANGIDDTCQAHKSVSTIDIRDYEVEGIDWLYTRQRTMLTDAPGLGKTMQGALAVPHGSRTLIVCPNLLVHQWYEWLTGTDEKSLERNHGAVIPNVPGKVAECVGNRVKRYRALTSDADWVVCNMEMLGTFTKYFGVEEYTNDKGQKLYRPLKGFKHGWDCVIFDEGHHMRRRQSTRAKVAYVLGKMTKRVYFLTATPIYKEVDDLYQQFHIIAPDVFTSYNNFVDTFCVSEDGYWGKKVLGVKKSMIPALQDLLDIMRLGRSYEDVGRELPPIIEKVIHIDLPPDVKKIYMQLIDQYRIEAIGEKFDNWMSVFHALRNVITGSIKVEPVAELLADEVRKAVIFSWYQDTADAMAKRIGDVEIASGRDKIADRIRKAKGDKHVSATIASLVEGVDLSDARTVIFAEENWTPGSNYQALSRVRRERIGGDNSQPVLVYYIICKGTIDEVIHKRSKGREGTIKEVVREALFG